MMIICCSEPCQQGLSIQASNQMCWGLQVRLHNIIGGCNRLAAKRNFSNIVPAPSFLHAITEVAFTHYIYTASTGDIRTFTPQPAANYINSCEQILLRLLAHKISNQLEAMTNQAPWFSGPPLGMATFNQCAHPFHP